MKSNDNVFYGSVQSHILSHVYGSVGNIRVGAAFRERESLTEIVVEVVCLLFLLFFLSFLEVWNFEHELHTTYLRIF